MVGKQTAREKRDRASKSSIGVFCCGMKQLSLKPSEYDKSNPTVVCEEY
jgi:hypothetical protein